MTSRPSWSRARRSDRLILAYVAGLLVVWAPGLDGPLFTPRLALAVLALVPGLVVLGSLVRRGDAGGRWLGALVAWSLVSALVSTQPRLSLLGTYGSDVGWVYLATYAASWALGRRLRAPATMLLPLVILGGVAANAGFAILEATFDPQGDLAAVGGRVLGLTSNPLFAASLLAGGLALAGSLVGRHRQRARVGVGVALIATFTAATNLTGSRAALVGGVALAVAGAVAGRRRGGSPASAARIGALVLAAAAAGLVLSFPVQSADAGSARVGDVTASSGYASRSTMWSAGLHAALERPLVGFGPGRFRAATSSRTTAGFARAEPPDRLFYDAHDLAVEQLVTTGVIGLALLGGFVVVAARRARGPNAWFAAGVALTWLVNPLSVCTAPVALVALGAAWSRPTELARAEASPRRAWRVVGAAGAVVALAVAGSLVWTDVLVARGARSADPVEIRRAMRLRPGDPVLQGLLTDALAVEANRSPSPAHARAVLESAVEATRLDPTRPTWWVRRGYAEAAYGTGGPAARHAAARTSFERALERNPWSLEAMAAMRELSVVDDDAAGIARWSDRICQVTPTCDPS